MRVVLPKVRPWLIVKKTQAALMTELLSLLEATKGPGRMSDAAYGRRQEIAAALKAANHAQ